MVYLRSYSRAELMVLVSWNGRYETNLDPPLKLPGYSNTPIMLSRPCEKVARYIYAGVLNVQCGHAKKKSVHVVLAVSAGISPKLGVSRV